VSGSDEDPASRLGAERTIPRARRMGWRRPLIAADLTTRAGTSNDGTIGAVRISTDAV